MTAATPLSDDATPTPTPYIVFGYGSLILRPPPQIIHKTPGFLKGYVRRFAQKSHDHRGTPEDWTTISAADAFPQEDAVWGVAFTIDPAHTRVLAAATVTDYRERDGYAPERVDVYAHTPNDTERVVVPRAECYIGRSDGPSFSCPLDALARTIWAAVRPSGRNKDYVYNLAMAVRALVPGAHDITKTRNFLWALAARRGSGSGYRAW
ncbi:ChaC-like protein-domain-containing protein [Gloeopeniophorella convolvens]|nr:ChaC-like protein-domain-containing protein [Gloeopeniophorella convolvens]